MPGELLVRGVADIVALGPAAHRVEVDVEEGGAAVAVAAEHHRLEDVGEELELVLDVFGREHPPVGHLADVLGPVDDPQVPGIRIEEPGVAGGDPALGVAGRRGALGIAVVLREGPGAAVEHLALLRDPDLHPRGGNADGVVAHLAVGLKRHQRRRLGLPVELLEVDADAAEEAEQFGPDRLARGVAHPHPPESERVLERAVDQHVADPVEEAVERTRRPPVENRPADPAGEVHECPEHPALDRARIGHADHHPGELVLEDARRREVVGRPDLADVGVGGLGALRAVHAEAAPAGLADREDEVAHPRHRKVGQHLLAAPEPVELDGRLRRADDGGVVEHHPLGPAGRARGVEHHAHAVAAERAAPALELAAKRAACRPAVPLHVGEAVQPLRRILPQAARIDVDDVAQRAEPVAHAGDLVDLLLVLDHGEGRAAVIKHVGHLLGRAVLVDRHGNRASRLHRHHGPVEVRPVAPGDGDELALLQPQLHQPQRERLDLLPGLRPAPALPDAELLLPIGGRIGEFAGVALEDRRDGGQIAPLRR